MCNSADAGLCVMSGAGLCVSAGAGRNREYEEVHRERRIKAEGQRCRAEYNIVHTAYIIRGRGQR